MSELWQLPATELTQLVRTREVSAREAWSLPQMARCGQPNVREVTY